MRYEIRKVTNTSKCESEHRGYVIAPDWAVAGVRASDAGLVRIGESFYAIPAYAMLPIQRKRTQAL